MIFDTEDVGTREFRLIGNASIQRWADIFPVGCFDDLTTMAIVAGQVTSGVGIDDTYGNFALTVLCQRHPTEHVVATQNGFAA
jgi:hypothetical protein